jgi:hypothetical protein
MCLAKPKHIQDNFFDVCEKIGVSKFSGFTEKSSELRNFVGRIEIVFLTGLP